MKRIPLLKSFSQQQRIAVILSVMFAITACDSGQDKFDASGTFEADEVIISAETSGTILQFDVEEGQALEAGQYLGYIDTTQLHLRKKQLESQVRSVLSQRPDIASQLAALEVQLRSSEREQKRISNLVQAGAATPKQLDDVNSQVETVRKQIAAQESSLGITSRSILEQASPLRIQIAQVEDQLVKSRIINPIAGTVLTKYAEAHEMVGPGKALYRIADMSSLTLRAYITGDQLPKLKLNQKATVLIDDGPDEYRSVDGVVTWISDKAEFTPKTIQTKDERANLVYAIKLKVKNDGALKIGMYGEVKF